MPGRLSDRSARFPAIVPEHADFLSTPLLLLHWFFPVLPGLVLAVRRSLPWQNLSGFRLPLSVCRGSVHPVSISVPAFWCKFRSVPSRPFPENVFLPEFPGKPAVGSFALPSAEGFLFYTLQLRSVPCFPVPVLFAVSPLPAWQVHLFPFWRYLLLHTPPVLPADSGNLLILPGSPASHGFAPERFWHLLFLLRTAQASPEIALSAFLLL